ncbi:MAG: bifunctional folylpolyglutamate synthase/dihydrofolate synthase [Elusimicrobia bacterium]|nr:bifunctional folylpolyglutamate synthase/dihydrofolate synthase [Elusimicrobiota bacterium]
MISSPAIRLGLDRVRLALERLGHPEDSFASVLVAGTNGKGSVCAMVESILRSGGYRTGLFTSPHLVDVRERIRVNREKMPASRWRALQADVESLARRSRLSLTEFEIQTLMAFLHFHRESVDVAVVEVGLGGRLDATNTLPAPEATVITSIGHDHGAWLGTTLKDIYFEKAGIARPGIPLLQSLPKSLVRRGKSFCKRNAVPSSLLGENILPVRPGLTIPLKGSHQRDNAALAVGVCESLKRKGWFLSERHVRQGLAKAVWPGRFQVVRPRGFKAAVVLDGAHNPEAAQMLAATYRASPWGRRSATLIFGCLKDKDSAGIIRALGPLARRVLTVSLPTPRTQSAAALQALWTKHAPAASCRDFSSAWKEASRDKGSPVLVTGSLYLVGEALKFFRLEV